MFFFGKKHKKTYFLHIRDKKNFKKMPKTKGFPYHFQNRKNEPK